MTRDVGARTTENFPSSDLKVDGSDGTFSFLEEERGEVPIIVFLVPGIRSDKLWAQDFIVETNSFIKRRIEARVVSGPTRLSSMHLIFRFGLDAFRSNFIRQIRYISKNYAFSDLNFVCHSMGSALIADIIEELARDPALCLNGRSRIKNIVFLGSVCHVSWSEALSTSSMTLINDVGTRDILPFVAHTVNCVKYGEVGSFGFNNCYAIDRFYDNNHTSCTSREHLIGKVMPLIEEGILLQPKIPASSLNLTLFTYIRRSIWALVPIAFVGLVIWL